MPPPTFGAVVAKRRLPHIAGRFEFGGVVHVIEIYADTAVMVSGPYIYEVYMKDEFQTEASFIEGFATRLDRYLIGGSWAGPDEHSRFQTAWNSLRRLFPLGKTDR